jgi:hypothetical protein
LQQAWLVLFPHQRLPAGTTAEVDIMEAAAITMEGITMEGITIIMDMAGMVHMVSIWI